MTIPQQKITEILLWIRDKGYCPLNPSQRDRYLNVINLTIYERRNLKPHQMRNSLWIPNKKGMKRLLPDLKLVNVSGMKVAVSGNHFGYGVGESEAILSLCQGIRMAA